MDTSQAVDTSQVVPLLDEAKRTMDSLRRPDNTLSCAIAYLIDTAANAAALPPGCSVEDALTVLGLARGAVVAATMLVREVHDTTVLAADVPAKQR